MRYSILGFSQYKVINLTVVTTNANGEEMVLALDVTDLLILNLLADFPNRVSVKKYVKDDKVFFWASCDEIVKELPVLNIKKQALTKRLDKLEKMHLIERELLTQNKKNNLTYFSLTKIYESLLYEKEDPSHTQIRDIDNNIKDNNKEDNLLGTNVPCEGEPPRSKEDSINWDEFLKFFNSEMANRAIPPIERMTDKRKSNVKARMRENGKEALFRMIKKAAASNFLNGDSSRGFLANFDWLFRPTNFLKVLEGNYDNREHNEQNNNYGTNRQPSPTEETTFAAESAITKLLATNKPVE